MADRSTEEEDDASASEADDAPGSGDEPTGYLDDVPDGCGCTAPWEAASEYREDG
jgi:hypothetical protein